MEIDSNGSLNGNGIFSAASPGRAGSVNLDDPDVRLAAEALGDLRAGMQTSAEISILVSHCIGLIIKKISRFPVITSSIDCYITA